MVNVNPDTINALARDMGTPEIPTDTIVRAMKKVVSGDDKDSRCPHKGEGILLHVLNVARTIPTNGGNGGH